MARKIGAIRQTNSAMIAMWKAITIGVAAIATAVAGAGRSGRTPNQTSAATPRTTAMMPPVGFA